MLLGHKTTTNNKNKQTDFSHLKTDRKKGHATQPVTSVTAHSVTFFLHQVIRMSYRQLTPEEEQLEERLGRLWETFQFNWQGAMEFINVQTPLITKDLQDTFQVSVKQGWTITFLDGPHCHNGHGYWAVY